eukprot:TRINITY_DN1752_c0_g2_i3.p1 TRINITY_DN1752_c0_g2~~TRINITY_DN1752_c0_g2_i3.p1  ORF type:complete len:702 (+),score=117.41 TRINITY_DN1752_c0_g2_i3:713-2818(+)
MVTLVCQAIKLSPSLKRVLLHNSKSGTWGTSLGKALEANSTKKIEMIYLSGSGKIKDPGAESLASALTSYEKLTSLVLSNMELSSKGLSSIISALTSNSNIANNLVLLDFSENQMDSEAYEKFMKLISGMGSQSKLQKLNVSATGINICPLFHALSEFQHLNWLGVCSNNFEENEKDKFLQFFKQHSPQFQTLLISSCNIPSSVWAIALEHLTNRTSSLPLFLDLSNHGLKELSSLSALKRIPNLAGLGLSNIALSPAVLRDFLPTTLCYLQLDNIPELSLIAKHIGQLLHTMPKLLKLSLRATTQCINLVPIFEALAQNKTLTRLDIRGQKCGSSAWSVFTASMRMNTSLRTVEARDNDLDEDAYLATLNLMYANSTCTHIDVLDHNFYCMLKSNPLLSMLLLESSTRMQKKYEVTEDELSVSSLPLCYQSRLQPIVSPHRPLQPPKSTPFLQAFPNSASSPPSSSPEATTDVKLPIASLSEEEDKKHKPRMFKKGFKSQRVSMKPRSAHSLTNDLASEGTETSVEDSSLSMAMTSPRNTEKVEKAKPKTFVLYSTKYSIWVRVPSHFVNTLPSEPPPSPPVGVKPYSTSGALWSINPSGINNVSDKRATLVRNSSVSSHRNTVLFTDGVPSLRGTITLDGPVVKPPSQPPAAIVSFLDQGKNGSGNGNGTTSTENSLVKKTRELPTPPTVTKESNETSC